MTITIHLLPHNVSRKRDLCRQSDSPEVYQLPEEQLLKLIRLASRTTPTLSTYLHGQVSIYRYTTNDKTTTSACGCNIALLAISHGEAVYDVATLGRGHSNTVPTISTTHTSCPASEMAVLEFGSLCIEMRRSALCARLVETIESLDANRDISTKVGGTIKTTKRHAGNRNQKSTSRHDRPVRNTRFQPYPSPAPSTISSIPSRVSQSPACTTPNDDIDTGNYLQERDVFGSGISGATGRPQGVPTKQSRLADHWEGSHSLRGLDPKHPRHANIAGESYPM